MDESLLTFQPVDLVVILVTGLILVVGLSLLALRRRNEILRDYLTPEEKDIEEQFFRRRVRAPEKQEAEPEKAEESPAESEVGSEWGTPAGDDNPPS